MAKKSKSPKKTESIASKILQAIRKNIVAVFKANKLDTPKSCRVSKVVDSKKGFEVLPGMNMDTHKTLGRVYNVATQKIGNKVKVEKSKTAIFIDVTKWYEKLQKEPEYQEKELEKEPKKMGRKFSKFGEQRTVIENKLKELDILLHNRLSGVLMKPGENEHGKYLVIRSSGDHITDKILFFLEETAGYRFELSEDSRDIMLYFFEPKQQEHNEKEELMIAFLQKFQEEGKENGFEFTFATPLTRATHGKTADLTIVFNDKLKPGHFASAVSRKYLPMKSGNTVHVSIPLEDIVQYMSGAIPSFIATKTVSGLLAKEIVTEGQIITYAYVHTSTKYDDFHFLSFNRNVILSHVKKISSYVAKWGALDFVKCTETDCIDGKVRRYILDGQHRFYAYKGHGIPIRYTLIPVSSKQEMVRLIAALNKTSRNWVIRDYLNAWADEDIALPEYILFKKQLDTTKLSVSTLFEVYGNEKRRKVKEKFLDGEFVIPNLEESEKMLTYVLDVRNKLPRDKDVISGFIWFARSLKDNYDHKKMITGLAKGVLGRFAPDDTTEVILKKMNKIYTLA